MKRLICLVLIMSSVLVGCASASEVNYNDCVRIVRNAYTSVVESNADGDAAYNEIYNVILDLRGALLFNNKKEIDYARVKLFGWEDESTNSELLEMSSALLEFIVPDSEDKLSALMQKFAVMDSVAGTITPTKVAITVEDMDTFVAELGLCKKATGYVLAMLNIYKFGGNAIEFTETGFKFSWTAIGAYKLKIDDAILAQRSSKDSTTKSIVITADSARVRTEPSITSGLIETVYKNETFTMLGESGDFYKISINGRTGYVHKGVSKIK